MRHKTYSASPATVRKARTIGIYGNTIARLSRMARRSAPVTNDYGNRRFMSYVLRVEGSTIQDVTYVNFAA